MNAWIYDLCTFSTIILKYDPLILTSVPILYNILNYCLKNDIVLACKI